MANFLRWVVSVRLYDKGLADPIVFDHGIGWWDNLADTARYGTPSYSAGRPTVEYLPEIGLTCKPARTLKDLRATHVTTSGGTWSEVRPVGAGSGRTYRILQSNTAAGIVWSATSVEVLPADPALAFTLLPFDTPSDWDTATYPPYVRIELGVNGAAEWGIEFSKTHGNAIIRNVSGVWEAIETLGTLDTNGDNQEAEVWVRVLRGQLGVSLDRGESYTWARFYDGDPVTISAGRWAVRGQGGGCLVGRHELTAPTGVFYSRRRSALSTRAVAPTVVFSGRYETPGSSTIVLADDSTHGSGILGYSATLTPQSVSATNLNIYRCPVLYTVNYRVATIATLAPASYATPWDSRVTECIIDKPLRLDESECSLTLNFPWSASAWVSDHRHRKIQVLLGRYYDDATTDWFTAFTGYIAGVRPVRSGFGDVLVGITAANVAHRLRRTRWAVDWELPLGNQYLGTALDQVLETEGIPRNDSYRQWDATTILFPLAGGRPEDPAHLTRRGEPKWQTMADLAGIAQRELAVSDTGVLQTVGQNYVTGQVHDIEAAQTTDIATENKALLLDSGIDYRETVTGVIVTGEDAYGQEIIAGGYDVVAEYLTSNERFNPWREVIDEVLPGTSSRGEAVSRAQYLAAEHFGLKKEPSVTTRLNLRIGRRDEVAIYGGEGLGILAGARHTVLSVRHHLAIDPRTGAYATVETRLGVRAS